MQIALGLSGLMVTFSNCEFILFPKKVELNEDQNMFSCHPLLVLLDVQYVLSHYADSRLYIYLQHSLIIL